MPPEQNAIPDVLQEWTIAVYGHSTATTTSPTRSLPDTAQTPSPGGDTNIDSPTKAPADTPDGNGGTPDPTSAPQGPSSSSRLSTFGFVLVTLPVIVKAMFGC